MTVPLIGLKFKEQLPAGPIRDEFEQLVAAIQLGFSTLFQGTVETVEVTNFIVSVQEAEISIASGSVSATVNLTTAIDPRYTEVALLGMTSTDVSGFPDGPSFAYISGLTDTTITATRGANSGGPTTTLRVMLTQYRASALRQQVQLGSIALLGAALTNTATIQAVGPKAKLTCTGWTQNLFGGANAQGSIPHKITKTNSTTITASNPLGGGNRAVGYCVVDFN